MRYWLLAFIIASSVATLAQSSGADNSAPSQSPDSGSTAASKPTPHNPNLAPPRSDRVNAADLGDDQGESSSKDHPIDLSPPPDDDKAHPQGSDILMDESGHSGGDVREFHPWDPHKAAKDIEIGDYYFKRKNYRAAEDRYREALIYKQNDALATFQLAVCLDKMDRSNEAVREYENYLKILPNGPQAEKAQKAIERLKSKS